MTIPSFPGFLPLTRMKSTGAGVRISVQAMLPSALPVSSWKNIMGSGAGRNFRTGLRDNPYIRALIETIKEKQEKRLEAMEMGKTRKTAPSGLVDIRDIHVDKTLPGRNGLANLSAR